MFVYIAFFQLSLANIGNLEAKVLYWVHMILYLTAMIILLCGNLGNISIGLVAVLITVAQFIYHKISGGPEFVDAYRNFCVSNNLRPPTPESDGTVHYSDQPARLYFFRQQDIGDGVLPYHVAGIAITTIAWLAVVAL